MSIDGSTHGYADSARVSITLRKMQISRQMDCRVKPGNDEELSGCLNRWIGNEASLDGSTNSIVIRGPDPRIHHASKKANLKKNGLPGQARNDEGKRAFSRSRDKAHQQTLSSYAGLTRVSITLPKKQIPDRWIAGSSPAMTKKRNVQPRSSAHE